MALLWLTEGDALESKRLDSRTSDHLAEPKSERRRAEPPPPASPPLPRF
ncbi:MAG: hypothetical protein H6633_34410 [Anaerolineales bacterium]|nr:hypothetical protein [Anaerolineales bacterium]